MTMTDTIIEPLGTDVHGLVQPRRGYRYTPELLLLPAFTGMLPARRLLDLGTGCGVLLVLMLERAATDAVGVGLDIQPEMVRLATTNIIHRGLRQRAGAVLADIRCAPLEPASFDVVVSNPPYYPVGWGRPSSNPVSRQATHEETATLHDFVNVAAKTLAPKGRLFLVYSTDRLADALLCCSRHHLTPVRLLTIRHDHRPAPHRVFLEAIREGCPQGSAPGLEVTEQVVVARRGD